MLHLAFLLFLFPTLALAAAAALAYPLKIFRPDAAGMKFKVTIVVGSRHQVTRTVRNQAAPVDEQIQATHLDATAEILEVDDKGHDLKIKYTVERFARVLEDGDIE